MGPLPQGKKQVRFLLVAINYFMKWVKAKALATITEANVQNFVWKNIFVQVWDSKDDHFKQWSSVRQSRIQVVLLKFWHQEQILVPRTSSGQWIDGSNKPNLAQDHRGSVSRGKRSMARRVTKRPMGLQDNNTDPNKRNTFQPNLWHISSHPSRSRCDQP